MSASVTGHARVESWIRFAAGALIVQCVVTQAYADPEDCVLGGGLLIG